MDALDLISVDDRTSALTSYEEEGSQKLAVEFEGKKREVWGEPRSECAWGLECGSSFTRKISCKVISDEETTIMVIILNGGIPISF